MSQNTIQAANEKNTVTEKLLVHSL